MDNRSSSNPMYAHHETMDVAPPRRWRAVIPSWLRSLIWVDAASSYDAFLSYSWKCDREVAPVMQAVMHQFLRPWYKVRARTIFRDLSCLPAGSDLESELFSRLDRSSNLIVLASPEAANSRGMELEAAYWLHRERTKREVLIVVTDRRPSEKAQPETWDEIRNHLIPPTFRNHFAATEPLWISIAVRRQEIVADSSTRGNSRQVDRGSEAGVSAPVSGSNLGRTSWRRANAEKAGDGLGLPGRGAVSAGGSIGLARRNNCAQKKRRSHFQLQRSG